MDIDYSIADAAVLRQACQSGVLRSVRLQVGATQSEWAAAVGCTASALSLIERGKVVPRTELAARLARVLTSAILAVELARP